MTARRSLALRSCPAYLAGGRALAVLAGIAFLVAAASAQGTGLAGGWSIDTTTSEGGARLIHPINTDKDGSIVAARVASALAGLGVAAVSDTRRSTIDATRAADETYAAEAAAFVVDQLYGTLCSAGSNPLLGKSTVVFSSVHRYGLYVAEALHARLLPLQYLAFADTWDQAAAAAASSLVIAGVDFDADRIWLWNKLAGGTAGTAAGALPPQYLTALQEADNVVVVQPNDQWVSTGCTTSYCSDVISDVYTDPATGRKVYVHSSLKWAAAGSKAAALYAAAKAAGRLSKPSSADIKNIKQWEWGVPDSAVTNVRNAWNAGGKAGSKFRLVAGGVNALFSMSAKLWRSYLAGQNGVSPRGFHFESYWFAHPVLERAAAALPFPSYVFVSATQGIDDEARKIVASTINGGAPGPFAANTRAFVNVIGGIADPDGVKGVLSDYGLTPANGLAAYANGYDLADAAAPAPLGWYGAPVEKAHATVAAALQNATLAPYWGRAWAPLNLATYTLVFPNTGGWDAYPYSYTTTSK